MPRYDVGCEVCGHEFEAISRMAENHLIKCEKCGGSTKVFITNSRTQHWFKPHINYEFTGEPIEVKSLNHYKQLCIRHGVTSRATGDVRNYTHKGRYGYDIEQSE